MQSQSAAEQQFNREWSTVGAAARDAMRKALMQLSFEELEDSHFLTQLVAKKLGVQLRASEQMAAKGKGKGSSKGKVLSTKPAGVTDSKQWRGPPKAVSKVAAFRKSLKDVLAERKQQADEHCSTNLDVTRTLR